jgi:hypothetical protein
MLFRRNQHLTSPATTRKELIKAHKVCVLFRLTCLIIPAHLLQWLDAFVKAREGDQKLCAVLRRYDRMLAAKREKERWKDIFRREMVRAPLLVFLLTQPSKSFFFAKRNGKKRCETAPSSRAPTSALHSIIELCPV